MTMKLSDNELNILMASLNSLDLREEQKLERTYGSVSALYNKLYSEWEAQRVVPVE